MCSPTAVTASRRPTVISCAPVIKSDCRCTDSLRTFRRTRQAGEDKAVTTTLYTKLVLFLVALLSTVPDTLAEPADAQLLDALRHGGYTLYFRHAPTEWSQQDRVRTLTDCASCDPQRTRQLAESGRALAEQIGATIRRLRIPVGEVWASEYCRTTETARLLNLGDVRTTRDVINARVAELVGGREVLARTARKRLATAPAEGTNTVIVAHGNVFLLAAGTRPPELGAAVLRANGKGGFTVVRLLAPEEWATLGDG